MRKMICLGLVMLLCGCNNGSTNVVLIEDTAPVVETVQDAEVPLAGATGPAYDEAFGVKCRYVTGEEDEGTLLCRKMEERPEWKVPVDGWQPEEHDGYIYVHQVYDADEILLLPEDYGSNTHKIIGLDGEEETVCEPCSDEE